MFTVYINEGKHFDRTVSKYLKINVLAYSRNFNEKFFGILQYMTLSALNFLKVSHRFVNLIFKL